MRAHPDITEFQRKHPIKIMPPASDALKKKMHDAVAWRAFRLYEARGCSRGNATEDWRQAEEEVVRPLDCGEIVQDHRDCLTTDVSCFGPGTLEIWVEPQRITLCGPRPSQPLNRAVESQAGISQENWIFRTHDLSTKVDSAELTVRFNGPALHIYLRRALPAGKKEEAELAHAA